MWAALYCLCIALPGSEESEMSPLCLRLQNLWAKKVCSQFKEFSQVEPPSLSLKNKTKNKNTMNIKPYLYKFLLSGWGMAWLPRWGWGWGQVKLFRNNIFIYIWLFISTSKTIWRFSVLDSCLRIPLPALGLGLARTPGTSVSNTLRVPSDTGGHRVPDIRPLCLGGQFISWVKSSLISSVVLANRQLATLLTWLLWRGWVIRGEAALRERITQISRMFPYDL